MQFASNGAVSPWCIFRTCVKHAASVKHAALSQLHRSNAQCRTNLPVLGATHASQTERSLHTQLREMARTSTVESPATAGFPLSEEADSLAASKERSQTAKTGLSQGSSATVLDDSQHPVTASAVPSYAWPVLLKLKLAGTA